MPVISYLSAMTTHVIAALRAKRIEVAKQVQEAEKRVAYLRASLANLDAAMNILTPEHPDHIPARGPYKRTGYFNRNELPRLTTDILRKASGPLTAGEIAAAAIKLKGLPASAQEAATRHVLVIMKRLADKGDVARSGTPRNLQWAIAPSIGPGAHTPLRSSLLLWLHWSATG